MVLKEIVGDPYFETNPDLRRVGRFVFCCWGLVSWSGEMQACSPMCYGGSPNGRVFFSAPPPTQKKKQRNWWLSFWFPFNHQKIGALKKDTPK